MAENRPKQVLSWAAWLCFWIKIFSAEGCFFYSLGTPTIPPYGLHLSWRPEGRGCRGRGLPPDFLRSQEAHLRLAALVPANRMRRVLVLTVLAYALFVLLFPLLLSVLFITLWTLSMARPGRRMDMHPIFVPTARVKVWTPEWGYW